MTYASYAAFSEALGPVQGASGQLAELYMSSSLYAVDPYLRSFAASLEIASLARTTHTRPEFEISSVNDASGAAVSINETIEATTPFAQLVRFTRAEPSPLPRILLVAPMSGHFSTLLAGTIRTLLQDHEVFLVDWLNPRDIPESEGRFGFDEYVDHVIQFLRFVGPESHLMGVCQPAVACLVAAAIMAEDEDPYEPASLILLAGPIDTRQSPTRVNALAQERPIEWFEENLISQVPWPYPGARRRVYPGFLQLAAFISMNKERHLQAFSQIKKLRISGEHEKAEAIIDFYREYFAVMDLPAEFYLETVEKVFQQHALPTGTLCVSDRRINCAAIRRPFLLTVEGERDDICGIGQTLAAQDLCSRMPAYKKSHLLQPGVGHYGVFNGKRWERRIYPVIREFIKSTG